MKSGYYIFYDSKDMNTEPADSLSICTYYALQS